MGNVVSMLNPKQSLAMLIAVSVPGKLFKTLPFVFSLKTANPEYPISAQHITEIMILICVNLVNFATLLFLMEKKIKLVL